MRNVDEYHDWVPLTRIFGKIISENFDRFDTFAVWKVGLWVEIDFSPMCKWGGVLFLLLFDLSADLDLCSYEDKIILWDDVDILSLSFINRFLFNITSWFCYRYMFSWNLKPIKIIFLTLRVQILHLPLIDSLVLSFSAAFINSKPVLNTNSEIITYLISFPSPPSP